MGERLTLSKRADRIGEAWQRFLVQGDIESYVVRDLIAASWERSLGFGVNPYGNLRYMVETKSKTNYRTLVKISRPFIDTLHNLVKGSDFMVLLADEEGTIVKVLGDPVILQKTRNMPFREGASWSESCCGTNCIGLAVSERMPVQVFAMEHFCKELHVLVGSAAPFFSPAGRLLGVLAIVGLYEDFHPHTLGLVVASVKAIENQLLYMEANQGLKRSYKEVTTIMEEMTAGLISVDATGKIIVLNTLGRKLLGMRDEEWSGKSILQLFGEECVLVQALREGRSFYDREITLQAKGVTLRFSASARVMKDEQEKSLGMVVMLREDKAIRRLINKAYGNQAAFTFADIIGRHPLLEKVVAGARRAAGVDNTVLIQGESGTGKEVFAQAIHNASERARGPFVPINCAGIPRELVESELFGYEAGSFTGASREGRPGKFELAQGGTIFLDEIGDMPQEIQSHLLRVLQEKTVSRLGGRTPIPVDVRVIVATHRDLLALVEEGAFRLDLFYRINVINLHIPSLRRREGDILLLAEFILEKISQRARLPFVPSITGPCGCRLLQYPWPGNVRELQNVLEQAVFASNYAPELCEEHLPEKLLQVFASPPDHTAPLALDIQESKHIRRALDVCAGNITRCAGMLGVGRNTLYRKIRKYNLKS